MNDDQRKEFCQMFYDLHIAPFGQNAVSGPSRKAMLQQMVDKMEDRNFAHRTTGEFNRKNPGLLRDMPPRPRWLTAEWLQYQEFAAYDPGHVWAGWACPLMTREQLEILLSEHNRSVGSVPATLELRPDGVLISRYDSETVKILAKDHGVDEPLYDIGSMGLCWEWAEEEDGACSCGSTKFEEVQLLISTAQACVRCGKVKK